MLTGARRVTLGAERIPQDHVIVTNKIDMMWRCGHGAWSWRGCSALSSPILPTRRRSCFQQGKGQAGLDQHQLRLWLSFHRRTVLSMCAPALLAVATARPAPRHGPAASADGDPSAVSNAGQPAMAKTTPGVRPMASLPGTTPGGRSMTRMINPAAGCPNTRGRVRIQALRTASTGARHTVRPSGIAARARRGQGAAQGSTLM